MSRFFFFIAEGLRALRRSTAPSLAAIVTVGVTVVLLGVLIPVLQTTGGKADELRDQVGTNVFLYDDATQPEIDALSARISRIPHVQSVNYIDKDEALNRLKGYLDDGQDNPIAELRTNPLPRSFEIQPDNIDNLESINAVLQPPSASGERQPISPAIEEVRDSRDDASPIRTVTSSVKIILAVIAGLLLLTSLLLVANTIRLSIYARRREVEVMRLVGATNWFIRWPFMVEGLACGFIGGVGAVGMLYLGKVTIIDPLSDNLNVLSAQDSMSFVVLTAILLTVAMGVSAIGSGLTLRRFMRV